MRRIPAILALVALGALSVGAQTLSDRYKENFRSWEKTLDGGNGASVHRGIDAMLQKEGLTVSHSDYNDMHYLVNAYQMAARACVLEGDWEGAVAYLQKAEALAAENQRTTGENLGKIRKEHEQYLAEWKESIAKQEPRLKELNEQAGLTKALVEQRTQLRDFIEERRNCIAQSERSIRDIDGILDWLKKDQEVSSKVLASWREFLAKEKEEITQAGSPQKYVAEKIDQVKADDARPRFDRLAYTRRLERLDPNPECAKFIKVLLGGEEAAEAAPAKPIRKARRRRG